MDTHVVFGAEGSAEPVRANRFAAASASGRSPGRGNGLDAVIAAWAILPCTRSQRAYSRGMNSHRFCLGGRMKAAFTPPDPASSFVMAVSGGAAAPASVRERRFIEEASKPTRRE